MMSNRRCIFCNWNGLLAEDEECPNCLAAYGATEEHASFPLPYDSVFGNLRITHTIAYYDFPVLFICQNGANHHYIAVWLEENDNYNLWLYAAISPRRKREILAGQIDLHDAFQEAEDYCVLLVTIYHDNKRTAISPRTISTIPEDWLPQSGEYAHTPS